MKNYMIAIICMLISMPLGCLAILIDEHRKRKTFQNPPSSFLETCKAFYQETVETVRGGKAQTVTLNGKVVGTTVTKKDYSPLLFFFLSGFIGWWLFINTILPPRKKK